MEHTGLRNIVHRWEMKYGHLPWYRRYGFLVPALIVTSVFSLFALPPMGKPENLLHGVSIIASFALFFGIAVLLITDREKPVVLKRLSSLLVIALFIAFFYLYSGTQWDRVQHQFFNFEILDGVWPLCSKCS